MKMILLAIPIAFGLFASGAQADVLLVQTNDWQTSRTVTWTCALDSIDEKTGLAHFHYEAGDDRKQLTVHISRILSLVIDDDDTDNDEFPATRQNLDSAIPSNLEKNRTIELKNDGMLGDRLPTSVSVYPSRTNPTLNLFGRVNGVSSDSVVVSVLQTDQTQKRISIDRRFFHAWIR